MNFSVGMRKNTDETMTNPGWEGIIMREEKI
jgi:hypothetical protein